MHTTVVSSHSPACGRTRSKQGRIKEIRFTLPLGSQEGAEVDLVVNARELGWARLSRQPLTHLQAESPRIVHSQRSHRFHGAVILFGL